MRKILRFILRHKFYSLVVIAIIAVGGYYGYQKYFNSASTVRYVTTKAARGALITSVSGTGQVSVTDQLDIKAKASGDITFAGVAVGQTVKAGTLLFQINATDAYKSVRDAQANLDSAKLSLQKLIQPADALTILQAENALAQAQESKQQSTVDLSKAYDDGFNTVANSFLDLPSIMNGLNSILYGNDFSRVQSNIDWYANQGISAQNNNTSNYDKVISYHDGVSSAYATALASYNKNFDDYKAASRSSDTSTVETLILETYNTTKLIANAVKNANNYLDLIQNDMENASTQANIPTTMVTQQASLNTYTSQTNSSLTNLSSIKQTIDNTKIALVNDDRTIAEKTDSLANLQAGADPLDVQSQQISLKQKENSLLDAQATLANYSVRAAFDGVVAAVSVKKGDAVSNGTSLGTLITIQQIATISLNEVDIAKIKVGQKANLTFDAVDGLNITGSVSQVDALGTVSQGVVSYNVQITFDVQDSRIKPGMSTSVNIILSSKPDVLMVPSNAVKIQGGASYVQILVNGAPQRKDVTVGDSNDTMTEIVSGVSEGDSVVTQTITTAAGSSAAATTAGSSGAGAAAAGGNVFRALGGAGGGRPD